LISVSVQSSYQRISYYRTAMLQRRPGVSFIFKRSGARRSIH
jgi:hypothetical protein